MSDAQQFLITKRAGKPHLTVADIHEVLTTDTTIGISGTEIVEVADTGTVETILPWRVIREDRTVAAVEDPEKALAVLRELADDLTLWRLEFHAAVI